MRKFKYLMLFSAFLSFCIYLSNLIFASETNPNVYVYVPVKSGTEVGNLLTNSSGDSGTDAKIVKDVNGDLALTFDAGGNKWKRTVVNLDISDVANERYKYISFDITPDSLMNLVISLK